MTLFSTYLRLSLIACLLLLSACASVDSDAINKLSAKKLYLKAHSALNNNNFLMAIEHYEKLEIDHPYSAQTRQAQMDIIYAYYSADEPDTAIAAANRFIKLYPRHERVDYAYYLRARVNFSRTSSTIDRMLNRDPSLRDPQTAHDSFRDFSELVERFPLSPYSIDARQRMIHLRNYLARHELHVAHYYLELKAYVAAANRSKYIIENYPRAPAITEALEIMAQAYQHLGLNKLAEQANKVLQLNISAEESQPTTANPG